MRIGTETRAAILPQIFLLISWVDISSADILHGIPKSNPLNIDWDPAPSPEDGPPLSAGASRDRSLLPAQIGAIVGAYCLSICIIAIALVVVHRKHRRQNILLNRSKDIEMTEQNKKPSNLYIPPTSPSSPRNFSYPSPEKNGPTPYVFPGSATSPRSPRSPYSPKTPASLDHPHVDTRIVERDQQIMGRDLEDLYAHVMEQEEAKAAGMKVAELPTPPQLQGAGPVPPSTLQGVPSPKKIEKRRPSNIEVQEDHKNNKSHSRTSSIISSLISPRRTSSVLKNLRISSPISPKSARWEGERGTAEENEPLTPRYYAPPPPPPVPKDQVPYTHRPKKSVESLAPQSPTRTIAEQLGPYGPGAQSAFHKHNPSSASLATQQEIPSAISATSATSNAPWGTSASAASSSRRLPLRQFEPALTSPSYTSFAVSTKTTVLERTAPASRGPNTAGLNTPWSAGAVPYSPYQPFTPMIPITPRLVTREERKMKERLEKKAGLASPRIQEDLVKDRDDLWDSGY
jgi:hypothetical protein